MTWTQSFRAKTPKILSSKILSKMHEKCDFNEKEMVFRSYLSLEDKNPWRFEEENEKIFRLDWSRRESEEKYKKLFEIVKNTWEEAFYKTQLYNFDWSKIKFSINQESIEHQSSQADCNQSFYRICDWSRDSFDRSKIWKTWILKNRAI